MYPGWAEHIARNEMQKTVKNMLNKSAQTTNPPLMRACCLQNVLALSNDKRVTS